MLFNLFKKNKDEGDHKEEAYLTLRIRETVRETPDTLTVYFEQPEPFLDYKPGQFLTLILELNGKQERRSYSLSTSPFVDPFPGITVKRLEGGLVSNHINDQFFPGKRVTVMKPLGNFVSDYHSQNRRLYGMIAGGSGITPIMGIIKTILINEPLSTVHLLYCSRSQDSIIFNEAIEALQKSNPGRLQVSHQLSQPTDGWEGPCGRLDKGRVVGYFKNLLKESGLESRFFICGPEGMMRSSQDALIELGVPREAIRTESFYLDKVEKNTDEETQDLLSRSITVELEGSEHVVDVLPGKTILEAGLEEGLDMPYSCQSGLCTACRGRLIAGKVTMDEDAGLSEKEIAEGFILCCSSKPADSEVKVRIE
ncbi:ring-1,2-phenylacetyl-CoA epoxidase subunit PaaE [Cyclobacterium xiamenense]|uniref:Ring-1,2-phenylacetyl-CoA epoxidase subunit PaaE n=1 Tax=Cyclobacterium xiamenense TaxID=1297121 RepID=A0A1H6YEB4_9BACT|nr:ferredoxin--NADP reductase [Cyclobacterium xiamenense]SEJ39623.1 ring-1,2-phenylacetyl-CoA epoxidase subunit PaaE [Cyclobacterium xiamenense]